MAPKTAKGGQRLGSSNDNFARSAYQTVMSPDNRSVVTAIGMFTVGVAFLHSSWAEILLPA